MNQVLAGWQRKKMNVSKWLLKHLLFEYTCITSINNCRLKCQLSCWTNSNISNLELLLHRQSCLLCVCFYQVGSWIGLQHDSAASSNLRTRIPFTVVGTLYSPCRSGDTQTRHPRCCCACVYHVSIEDLYTWINWKYCLVPKLGRCRPWSPQFWTLLLHLRLSVEYALDAFATDKLRFA